MDGRLRGSDFAERSFRYGPGGPTQPAEILAHSFISLLVHLATLTRNGLPYGTDPNTIQRRAFELLGCPIPIGLK